MKKLIIILVAVCIVCAAVIGIVSSRNEPSAKTDEPSAAPVSADTETAGLDFAAMRAKHNSDEVVMTVDGAEITWDEYYYWLAYNAAMIQSYLGEIADWNEELYDGESYAQFVTTEAENACRQYHSLETFAKKEGFKLTDDDLLAISEQKASDIISYCGEGATEADFEAYLSELNMSLPVYEYITSTAQLYQSGMAQLYGKDGANVTDEQVQSYLAEHGYMNANHILFLTTDMSTGEALSEDAIAEKLASAQAVCDELRAIEDKDALVARFLELKQELDEDSGKTAYPNGYIFTSGMMVPEFEAAVQAQGEFEISDPVKTDYGYHVIITLPLADVTPDTVIDMSYGYTAAYIVAAESYSALGQSYFDNAVIEYAPAFKGFAFTDLF